ncbi:uncharacterized protein LOC110457280 [Mizuhopecten yessoensis]|uniref:Protein sleepless n=1 Tax=Mizuhopecten yessoensis TaxID=6573 RepID=A0A210R439_MIZYE|nr:uncharacterized protein LOC110457280 [Mizuhopecten yessoensis]OWF55641.1 hypothetical protein KP79_PYT20983 [Mizuhopecten yessoensis]
MSTGKECCNRHFIALTLLVFIGYFGSGECLLCYQCSDSVNDGKCRTDIEGMEKEFIEEMYLSNISSVLHLNTSHYTYLQLCDEEYCTVQEITQSGKTVGFIRGCSDKSRPSAGYTIANIQANNRSVCGISMTGNGMLVCGTFCQTDLCNGPQADRPVNNGNALFNGLVSMEKTVLMVALTFVLSSKNYI